MRYLEDYRDQLGQFALDHWAAGALTALQEHEGRGRYITLQNLLDLEYEHILTFYDAPMPKPDGEQVAG